MKHLYEAAGKNLHMTHVDELPIMQGAEGVATSLEALDKAFEKVLGMGEGDTTLNVKWDGAPAVYAGWHPESGDFLLALKSLFAKKPKIVYTPEDAETHYGDKPDLMNKILSAYEVLEGTDYIPQGEIWQGDFLFSKDDLSEVTIDGEEHFVFQPNTILYAVKKDSDPGKEIGNSDVGIVWHTRYKGNELETMTSSFDIDEDEVNSRPNISNLWAVSPHYTYTGEPVGDIIDTDTFTQLRSRALVLEDKLQEVDEAYTEALDQRKGVLAQQFNSMINDYIRRGKLGDIDPDNADELFLEYLEDKFSTRRENYQAKGKKDSEIRAVDREHERVRNLVMGEREEEVRQALRLLAQTQKTLHQMKMLVIQGLNRMANRGGVIKTFLVKRDGTEMEPASHEGFVIQTSDGTPLKFVDREQFSKANFSDEYIKGWEH